MQDNINNLIGKDLTKSLKKMIRDFIKLKYDEEEIYRNIKNLNDISIMALYLLSTKYKNNISYYIEKSYERLLDNRVNSFKKSVKLKKYKDFLNKQDKTNIINMAYYMNLYKLTLSEINNLTPKEQKYYKILNDYIKNMV